MTKQNLIGDVISEIKEGQMDDWDQTVILTMKSGRMYIIQSGSSNSQGILSIAEIFDIPKEFKEIEFPKGYQIF